MSNPRWHIRFALGLCLAAAALLSGGCSQEDPDDPLVYISGAYYYSANDPKKPADAKPYRKSLVVAKGYAAAPLPQTAPRPILYTAT